MEGQPCSAAESENQRRFPKIEARSIFLSSWPSSLSMHNQTSPSRPQQATCTDSQRLPSPRWDVAQKANTSSNSTTMSTSQGCMSSHVLGPLVRKHPLLKRAHLRKKVLLQKKALLRKKPPLRKMRPRTYRNRRALDKDDVFSEKSKYRERAPLCLHVGSDSSAFRSRRALTRPQSPSKTAPINAAGTSITKAKYASR